MQDEIISPNSGELNTDSVDDIDNDHDELDMSSYNEIEVTTSPNTSTSVATDTSTSQDIMPAEHIMVT